MINEDTFELFIDYVLGMLDKIEITKLHHALENLKTALPYIDYFKKDEFFKEYLTVKEDNTDAE